MKPFKSYENARVLKDAERLPIGGYIINILSAEEINYSWGDVLEIKFDIAEGDFKDYYTNQYKNSQLENKKYKGTFRINIPKDDGSEQDGWTANTFKTNIDAIEESNPGFHWAWDEKQLIGKKVGAMFCNKEWEMDGNTGFYTALHRFHSIEAIKSGKVKIPADKLLKNKAAVQSAAPAEFAAVTMSDEDLPFFNN